MRLQMTVLNRSDCSLAREMRKLGRERRLMKTVLSKTVRLMKIIRSKKVC